MHEELSAESLTKLWTRETNWAGWNILFRPQLLQIALKFYRLLVFQFLSFPFQLLRFSTGFH